MQCLIIAAGKGSRLAPKGSIKPLVPLLGVPLIERVIRTCLQAGIHEFQVVTGYRGAPVREFLDSLAGRLDFVLHHLINDEWERENGLSVLTAERFLTEPFLLVMGDHLPDPEILSLLIAGHVGDDEVVLAVDHKLDNPHIDPMDVTRVRIRDGRVTAIGKNLGSYNGFDTGAFLCSPALFAAIRESGRRFNDTSLTGGIRQLAERGKVRALDIGDAAWIDVDDPAALQRAEDLLISRISSKVNDGPVATRLNRPLSTRLSRYLAAADITPNQISLFSFALSLFAAALFLLPGYTALAAGGLLAQVASIIDGCDGEIARLTYRTSDYGGWLDAVLDRYADALLLFALTLHVHAEIPGVAVLVTGFLAVTGSFLVSYTADKHDSIMRQKFSQGKGLRIGRDLRILLLCTGALLNHPLAVLAILALIMNGETIRRLFVCRKEGANLSS